MKIRRIKKASFDQKDALNLEEEFLSKNYFAKLAKTALFLAN